ncbi:hypothetical protein [Edaphobacter aggregans]|uniref:hypothetical protein n=1 Tax=Edaphobacter aggregans TaxID=570835 RepID=UPI000553B0E0|nr:hypothetical protein [Edaphobacter aggregans]
MRVSSVRAVAWSAVVSLALIGCKGDQAYVVPEEPMPPNTILLAGMMRELSATPGFVDGLLARLGGDKQGPALMSPKLISQLRELILGKDWQGLDRFPGWTLAGINPTVKLAGRYVAKKDDSANVNQGGDEHPPLETGTITTERVKPFIDLGPYTLEKAEVVDLDKPSTLPGFTTEGIVSDMGAGVVRGDGPNPTLAPMRAESQRMADALNRLSANALSGAAAVKAKIGGHESATPEQLIEALMASGHSVVVYDARYFANFGHFHFTRRGSDIAEDVMMPFWMDSQIAIPGTKRSLLVPVSHAEYEWEIRAPKDKPGINANVSWYFGIDGKSEFRTMDTQDQAWVLGRHAHTYRDKDAIEVTRLVGKMVVAFLHQHMRRPDLPFGGYYPLGVCQDGVAAIEKKMTGHDTLFPNTADIALFDDPRDAEVNAMMAAIPKDYEGGAPAPERIFGSLPADDFNSITVPGLAQDLTRVKAAWDDGSLERTPTWMRRMILRALAAAAVLLLAWLVLWRRRRAAH